MKTYAELLQLIQGGARPVVTFQNTVGDLEIYAEVGMRARIVGITRQDDMAMVTCDFGEFDAHNRLLETANYYGKDGKANKTAREAGFYKPVDHYYGMLDQDIAEHIRVDNDAALALLDEYKVAHPAPTSGGVPQVSYMQWLEQELLAARAGKA